MADTVYKVRITLLNEDGEVAGEADVQTSADLVFFDDGETFQQKLDSGELKGADGAKGDKGDKGDTGAAGPAGTDGEDGADGATWLFGTSAPASSSGKNGDWYLNTSNWNVYNKTSGAWTQKGNIKGATGSQGPKGENGATPTVSAGATVDDNIGTPSVTVTKSGTTDTPNFNFAFKNLKGAKGDTGAKGEKGDKGSDGKGAANGIQLTDQDLNDYKTESQCGWYYGSGGNTVINKPQGTDAFGMWLLRVAQGYYQQECHCGNEPNEGKLFVRTFEAGVWTQWIEKGKDGKQGPKGETGAAGADGAKGDKGEKGDTGTRGSTITYGTAITGTSTTGTVFSNSGITSALVNDLYINTSTYNIYRCITAGAANVAKWAYVGCIKGATGAKGDKGEKGDTGPAGADGDGIKVGSDYESAQSRKLFFKIIE